MLYLFSMRMTAPTRLTPSFLAGLIGFTAIFSGSALGQSDAAEISDLIVVREADTTEPIVLARHIKKIEVAETKDHQFRAEILLKDTAADRFQDYTRAHVGKKLDILVLGRLVSTPVILAPIATGRIMAFPLTAKDAEALRKFKPHFECP